MAKQKYRVRVLQGAQELVLLVPAAPETTVGELQADVLARARRKHILGSACELSIDGASLDEFDSLEDVVEVDQMIDAELSPPQPSRITPAKRSEPEGGLAPAPAGEGESEDEEYHWPAAAPRGAARVGAGSASGGPTIVRGSPGLSTRSTGVVSSTRSPTRTGRCGTRTSRNEGGSSSTKVVSRRTSRSCYGLSA